MTDMPHNPAFAAPDMLTHRLRAAVQRVIAQLLQPGRDVLPEERVWAERHLAAARRREEARRAANRLLR